MSDEHVARWVPCCVTCQMSMLPDECHVVSPVRWACHQMGAMFCYLSDDHVARWEPWCVTCQMSMSPDGSHVLSPVRWVCCKMSAMLCHLSDEHVTRWVQCYVTCQMRMLPDGCHILSPVRWACCQTGAIVVHLCIMDHVLMACVHLTHDGHLPNKLYTDKLGAITKRLCIESGLKWLESCWFKFKLPLQQFSENKVYTSLKLIIDKIIIVSVRHLWLNY